MYHVKTVWGINSKKEKDSRIQEENEIHSTGENQDGFKRERRTATLSIVLQCRITRAIDKDEYRLVSSFDFS